MALRAQDLTSRPTVIKTKKKTENHSYNCSMDTINKRMIVHSYAWEEPARFVEELFAICRDHDFGKLIVQSREADWQMFLSLGFQMEGTIESFFNGEPVYYMSKFFDEDRRESPTWMDEESILEKVLLQPTEKKERELPRRFKVELATKKDIPQLVELFKKVFATYPSPLTDPHYLSKSMDNDVFVLVREGKKLVSAAGAEIDRDEKNAEMTNCATLPEMRGYGLMNHIFAVLEPELKKQEIHSLFSIARAKSFGMNRVLHQHGYEYRGRLVNNCDICGGFEDMNLWAKDLRH
ncbi:MAG TPA: putative beta-lysine N-acetyltransferase [Bacilli bacterium]|nr:putative beta-lysine N-acetyltransferase [Bacilli bacterium]